MQVLVDNLVINYEVTGKGKTLLFIHGWGDDLNNLKKAFNSLSNSYQIVFLDLPGFGKSELPKEPLNIDDFSKVVTSFCRKLNFNIYALIGHSFGGAVSIKLVANKYLNPDRLILMDASGIRDLKKSKLILKTVTKAGKILSSPLPYNLKNKLKKQLYTKIKSDYLLNESLKETFKKIVSEDLSHDASTLKLNTLIIYGENDPETPVRLAYLLHELIKNSTLEIIGDASHYVFLDQNKRVLNLVKDFLNVK